MTIIISRAPDCRKFALEPTAFCWQRASKKLAGSVDFGPNSFLGGLGFFSPTPLSDPQETNSGARNCAQTVRKLRAKCAEMSKFRQFATQYPANLNV